MIDLHASAASRRDFVRTLSLGLGATLVAPSAFALPPDRKLGVALLGLGNYSTGQLAPALQQTKNCRLAGVVTGSPEKAAQWQKQYGIPAKNCYDYKTFDRIVDNPDIDIVYVVTPNALHAEYVVRAAQAGKHVICEKPMATTEADARRMIAACNKAGKKLSIGYRLHFEPHNQEMMRLGQQQAYGKINHLVSNNGFKFGSGGTPWRVEKALSGGGPLMDMGIYSLQGCIYTKGQVPVSITAKLSPETGSGYFKEVEAGVDWQMQFADGSVANCSTSYAQNMQGLLLYQQKRQQAQPAQHQPASRPNGRLRRLRAAQQTHSRARRNGPARRAIAIGYLPRRPNGSEGSDYRRAATHRPYPSHEPVTLLARWHRKFLKNSRYCLVNLLIRFIGFLGKNTGSSALPKLLFTSGIYNINCGGALLVLPHYHVLRLPVVVALTDVLWRPIEAIIRLAGLGFLLGDDADVHP
jgi:predicted dehydrogenase